MKRGDLCGVEQTMSVEIGKDIEVAIGQLRGCFHWSHDTKKPRTKRTRNQQWILVQEGSFFLTKENWTTRSSFRREQARANERSGVSDLVPSKKWARKTIMSCDIIFRTMDLGLSR